MTQFKQSLISLDQSSDVYIYILRDFNPDNPFDVFRFSNQQVSWGGSISLIPVTHKTIEITSTGPVPRLEINVGDPNGVISNLIDSVDGLEGSSLKIIRTKFRFTDGGSTPDSTAKLQEIDYIISRVISYEPWMQITFEGSSPLEFGQATLPSRYALRSCVWEYRGPECGYTGTNMFTLADQATTDPTKDECGKSIRSCKLRFGNNLLLPTSAFPTLSRR